MQGDGLEVGGFRVEVQEAEVRRARVALVAGGVVVAGRERGHVPELVAAVAQHGAVERRILRLRGAFALTGGRGNLDVVLVGVALAAGGYGGILHGGAYMAFADTLGAVGTFVNLPEGKMKSREGKVVDASRVRMVIDQLLSGE